MNLDRATLNFLNSFSEDAKKEGQRLHDDGAVVQIFGNHLHIQGRVEEGGWACRTTLRLEGNDWRGQSSLRGETGAAALYATMLERLARGAELPESPNESGGLTLTERVEESLDRMLTGVEDEFLGKLERRFRRFEIDREIFDHDLVRLHPRWPVEGYEPITELWPEPPRDIVEFWNYVAYAIRKRGLDIPGFLEDFTDFAWAEDRMREWEHAREISEWRYTVDSFESRPPDDGVEGVTFRLRIGGREARLLSRREGDEAFERIADAAAFSRLRERYNAGGLRMDGASDLLWSKILRATEEEEDRDGRLNLERLENCRLLNRLFHQEDVRPAIVTLDETPFRFAEGELRWVCRPDTMGSNDYELQLVTGGGEEISHVLRLLPGEENLYLSDEWVFRGPEFWRVGESLVEPRYALPREVIESEAGVVFLGRVGADLPEDLARRVREESLSVRLDLRIVPGASGGAGEHIQLRAVATNSSGTREETLGREGWSIAVAQPDRGEALYRYDRTLLHRVPRLIAPLQPVWDPNIDAHRVRVTKNFPERYTEWRTGLPPEIAVHTDGDLASLEAEPVEAAVSFEVVNQEIDWFDLKVVVNVEGLDLTQDEIRALVAARGDFVRMESGGWLRLRIALSEEQSRAVSRIGLDPFDLSGQTHRLHALQLAEPMAKEVFDAKAWEKITKQAGNIALQVRPETPGSLNVTLRPYQIEGFHFLSYLTTNRFGGILADDMGLGKTIQALTWLLWLRREAGSDAPPSLVVCPKSVLDVWAAEVRKAAPSIRVRVLRNRADLDVSEVETEIDLLVMNYAQLRGAADQLKDVEWLATILDEGQQIKNPDSKAAKAARQLKSRNRLVLTGTPIENRLLDVWSLMAFAMPGILGDRKYFRDRFDKRRDAQSHTRLTARLRPFLLRRTKSEVALDLPPKTEEDVFCDLESTQADLYREELERIRKILLGIQNDESLRKNSFVILQGLMRLRQICCHPGLIDSRAAGEPSAKLTALFYLLDQLREEGHKVLVFSQFVSMLDIIRDRLEEEGRPYSYLTGQTKDRHAVIEDFQTSPDPKVFLLSLKAGGSGLNLTAASYVVLYDPWWNPAVENQAIDRCHRIGQESKVIAYRLLVRDSVEEKIRLLQNQKRAMMTGVLGEEGFARNLRREDLDFLFSEG
ncbi:MAG: DEAD/DEAH box helicase [Verrucomicrobiae bacterium]|nr:DEAD/DEAH box helicase [Verrucomicrobiae bacterium]MCP5550269.1 DEAD/DEAH box helicase [Akkermansiaceae bacterium]